MHLQQARAKIKRADHHIEEIESRIAALHKTQHSTVQFDPKTGEETLIHDFRDTTFFEDSALILGDAIHNLNCALDYIWLETITCLAPSLIDDKAKFPVRKNVNEVKGWLDKAGVDKLSLPLYRFMLDDVCLHVGWQAAIRPIHDLDIRDKHRLLIPVLSQGNIAGIEVKDEAGNLWPGYGVSGELQHPPYCIRYNRRLHVTKKGKLTAQIVIEDADSGYGLPMPEQIAFYSRIVTGFVELFERFLQQQGF